MGLRRLGISNPAANTDVSLFTADNQYLLSVIATNKSTTTSANIRVWIQPFGSTTESQYAYIVYDIPVDPSNSYETFRFAVNQNDAVYIRSSTANLSFQAIGLVQYDVKLGAGISSYQPNAPTTPVNGMIWVDSDATNIAGQRPAYVYDGSIWQQIVGGVDVSANYTFTGTVQATTQPSGTSNTTLATTAFVSQNFEKTIPLSSSAPLNPASSDLWVDSSGTQPILKVYNGSSWISLASPADDDQIILSQRMFSL